MTEQLDYADDDLVWHYTDAAGLHGIVQTHRLRATAANHLNDSAELREGWERLQQAVESLADNFEDDAVSAVRTLIGSSDDLKRNAASIYSISASTDKDNLSLWRYYGGNASYAIGLDKTVDLAPYTSPLRLKPLALPVAEQDFTEEGEPIPQQHVDAVGFDTEEWLPVSYNPEDKSIKAQALRLLQEAENKRDISLTNIFFETYRWFTYGGHKHQTFAAEKEVRWLFSVDPEPAFASYRSSHDGLVRYLEIAAHSDETPITRTGLMHEAGLDVYGCLLNHSKLPIRSVRLSPTGHRESALGTLKDFLAANGYADVDVSRSESPYIG